VANAIHAVVQIARLSDGTRKVITVSEIVGMHDDTITMQDIFTFERVESTRTDAFAAPLVPPATLRILPIAWLRRLPPECFAIHVPVGGLAHVVRSCRGGFSRRYARCLRRHLFVRRA